MTHINRILAAAVILGTYRHAAIAQARPIERWQVCDSKNVADPGKPIFFPQHESAQHGGVAFGVSLPKRSFLAGEHIPAYIWIDNTSGKDYETTTCGMFAEWNAKEMEMQKRRDFLFTGGMALFGNQLQASAEAAPCSAKDHSAWVAQVLKRMQTIQPGMTRESLLTVFTTEGGLSTALQQTFRSQDCPYFKVSVRFAAVGRPDRDPDGRVTTVQDPKDVITFISKPFLEFTIAD